MSASAKPPADSPENGRSLRLWKHTRSITRVGIALCVAAAVFLVAWGRDDSAVPVLPDTEVQFSLDLSVVGAADLDTIYVVEQRARPAYRIFAFEPATGQDRTIFTVPEDAIIYGITLSPDRQTLAIAYSPDFHIEGSGVWTLQLDTLEFTEIVPAETGIYLTEPEYASDQATLFTTHVDRRAQAEQLSIAQIDIDTGTVTTAVESAINPAVGAETLFYLTVDEEQVRRSIGSLTNHGGTEIVVVGTGSHDLDHLLATDNDLYVAVLEDTASPELTLGETADAHGNHNVASTWWTLDSTEPVMKPTAIEPIIVYDASTGPDDTIAYATLTGLAVVADDQRIDLIASRAIRFVAN